MTQGYSRWGADQTGVESFADISVRFLRIMLRIRVDFDCVFRRCISVP